MLGLRVLRFRVPCWAYTRVDFVPNQPRTQNLTSTHLPELTLVLELNAESRYLCGPTPRKRGQQHMEIPVAATIPIT